MILPLYIYIEMRNKLSFCCASTQRHTRFLLVWEVLLLVQSTIYLTFNWLYYGLFYVSDELILLNFGRHYGWFDNETRGSVLAQTTGRWTDGSQRCSAPARGPCSLCVRNISMTSHITRMCWNKYLWNLYFISLIFL